MAEDQVKGAMIPKGKYVKEIICISSLFFIIFFLRFPYANLSFFNLDEGLYAAAASKILHGGVMYKDAVDPCGPITPYFYAFIFKFFGNNNMYAVHVALIGIVFFILCVLFFLGRLIKDTRSGFIATVFFIVFSLKGKSYDVLSFETEWIAALFSVLGVYFLLKYFKEEKSRVLFFSGLFFGCGFFSKQLILFHFLSAILFLIFDMVAHKKNISGMVKSVGMIAMGFLSVVYFFSIFFYCNHAFQDFRFWFWEYHNRFYVPEYSGVERIKLAFQYWTNPDSFVRVNFFLVLAFFTGIIITVVQLIRHEGVGLTANAYFALWGVLAYMGTAYSGRNAGHYFILMLPPFCLLAARTVSLLFDFLKYSFPTLRVKKAWGGVFNNLIRAFVVVLICLMALASFSFSPKFKKFFRLWEAVFLQKEPVYPKESFYSEKSWERLSSFIKENSREDDKIFVWGFYPEIYAFSNRLPASRYINANFLTGLIPWTNTEEDIDTRVTIVPGSWEIFVKEMRKDRPLYIVDTSFGNINYYGKYPPQKFKELFDILNADYAIGKEFFKENGEPVFRLYERVERNRKDGIKDLKAD